MIIQTKTVLPAEWSPQDAILLCWPHKSMDWHSLLDKVEPVFEQIADNICRHQALILIAHDKNHQTAINQRLIQKKIKTTNIKWLLHPNNDTWCRDYGPITVFQKDRCTALNFTFNGWGEKFDHYHDNITNQKLQLESLLNCDMETIDLVLEGGSIESDGLGTLLTTRQCLLSPKRNTQLSQQQIETKLTEHLGCDRVLWLTQGYLEGDDTDSHIDNLARFCNPTTIAYASCDDKTDTHYDSLKAMESELKAFVTKDNDKYSLIPLAIPKPIFDDGQRLPASYANFLITNQHVLVPTFDDPQDTINIEKLQSVFSDREVIAISSKELIKQSGSIHCLSMQLPAQTLNTEK